MFRQLHLVQAGRQRLNRIEALQDRAMLVTRHACGDENAEVSDMRVGEIHDSLAGGDQSFRTFVHDGNPAERLVRWRDVVAVRGKDDDRFANAP